MKLYYVSITIGKYDTLGEWATSAKRVGNQLVIQRAGGGTRIFPIEKVREWGTRNVTPDEAAKMAEITGKSYEA